MTYTTPYLFSAIQMRPGHRRIFPIKIQKAREEIDKLQAKQKREEEDQEEIRKKEKAKQKREEEKEKAKQKRHDEKAQQKEELAKVEMERELQQVRNMRDVEDQEQKLKVKSGFGLQTEDNMKDSTQQARVEISQALLPPSKEWGMCYMIYV